MNQEHLFLKISFLVSLVALGSIGLFWAINPAKALKAGPRFQEPSYYLPKAPVIYFSNMLSGGPAKDGIPSIDNPEFILASQASENLLKPGDIVIGYASGGQARAYPQKILVHHEIVNDVVAGENVTITYCPLTATAQGFKRGSTTLGVSGRLINSNLVIYDRATNSFYPQILATGITGPNKGKTLKELNVIWTTWKRWKNKYPTTKVLSKETGYLRNYSSDPYGSYNPLGGYYSSRHTIFPLMNRPTDFSPKTMVLGARTRGKSVYVPMNKLRNNGILWTENFLVVYGERLDTGYIYSRETTKRTVKYTGKNRYRRGDKIFKPSELPLEKHVSFQGFYFAWNAYYPDSETI